MSAFIMFSCVHKAEFMDSNYFKCIELGEKTKSK